MANKITIYGSTITGFVKKKKNGNPVIENNKAAVVRQIFELYVSGSGLRMTAVLRNEMIVLSPTGRQ